MAMVGILKRQNYQGDRVLWVVAIILLMISSVAVYSAISTLAAKAGGNTLKFLLKHLMMIGIGFTAMYAVHKVNFKYFSKLSQYLFYLSVGLLMLTMLIGVNLNSANRWLRIPFLNINFQTSDFAKLALILYLARTLNINRTILHDFKTGFWPVLWPAALVCALILKDNFSTAAMLFGVCFLVMFIGGVPVRFLGRLLAAAILGIGLLYGMGKLAPKALPRFETWVKRIESFANPASDGNYQLNYAKEAIRSGTALPKGPGTSVMRSVLPHPYNDMIFAFIIEEYGSIIGCGGLILLYLIIGFRAVRNGIRCPKYFGSMVSIGLGLLLLVQALTHMAVAVGLFPTTGQPLPLVSMGGTTTIINLVTVGILISVSRLEAGHEPADQPDTTPIPEHVRA